MQASEQASSVTGAEKEYKEQYYKTDNGKKIMGKFLSTCWQHTDTASKPKQVSSLRRERGLKHTRTIIVSVCHSGAACQLTVILTESSRIRRAGAE